MNQSSSFCCWLSMLSPVETAQSNGRLEMGPAGSERMRSTMALPTCVVSVSWGR